MRIWKEDDRSRDVCERCEKIVASRFERRTFHLEKPRPIDVPNVLVTVCEECGAICSVPPQSSPRLREARRPNERIDVLIPRVLEDVMGLVADKFGAGAGTIESPVVRHYLARIVKDRKLAARVGRMLRSVEGLGRQDVRTKVRVSRALLDDAMAAAKPHLEANTSKAVLGQSDLIRAIMVTAAVDAGVIEDDATKPDQRSARAIEAIATAAE